MKTQIFKTMMFTPRGRGRWGLPALAWGEPGVAKSGVLEEMCASFGLPCVVLSPCEMGEAAFGVVPMPNAAGTRLHYPIPEWFDRVADGGVVFVDELTSSPPALFGPAMALLHSGRIGGAFVGPRVRVLAAANPPDIAAVGSELPPPVANRVGHVPWEAPSVDEHVAFMLRGDAPLVTAERTVALDMEARVMAEWGTVFPQALGLEAGFLRAQPHKKNACPRASDPSSGHAWPSDRTWEMATRAYAGSLVHGLGFDDTVTMVAAFVGTGVATEFLEFVNQADLPNVAQLLDGEVEFEHRATRVDRTAAVLSAATAMVAPKAAERREERASALWGLVDGMLKHTDIADILVPAARMLTTERLQCNPGQPGMKVLSRMHNMLSTTIGGNA